MGKKKEQEQVTESPKIVWQNYLTVIDENIKSFYYVRIIKTINDNYIMEYKDNKTDAMKTERWFPIRQIYR